MSGEILSKLEDRDYAKLYVKYKIWVQHKQLPKKLLSTLPIENSRELVRLYYAEKKSYEDRKRKVLPQGQETS